MIEPMSPEIAAAIVQVMGGVKKLGKDEKNKFANYDFVSIDNFLEAVNPLCAEAGLFFILDETSWEIRKAPNDHGKEVGWLYMTYDVTIAHASGALHGPLKRNVIVQAGGAQAFGSAQSYVLKQLMRGLFQIPTGDKDDPDFSDKGTLPARDTKPVQRREPQPKDVVAEKTDRTNREHRGEPGTPFDAPARTVAKWVPAFLAGESYAKAWPEPNNDSLQDQAKKWGDFMEAVLQGVETYDQWFKLSTENAETFQQLKQADEGRYNAVKALFKVHHPKKTNPLEAV